MFQTYEMLKMCVKNKIKKKRIVKFKKKMLDFCHFRLKNIPHEKVVPPKYVCLSNLNGFSSWMLCTNVIIIFLWWLDR